MRHDAGESRRPPSRVGPWLTGQCGQQLVRRASPVGWHRGASPEHSRWHYAAQTGPRPDLIQAIPETAWSPIPHWIAYGADVAYTPFRDKKDAVSFRRHRVPLKTLIGLVGTQPELAG